MIEIHAFIGLLYLAGAYKSNSQYLEELWGQEGDGIEKFGLVMNIKRFKILIRCLRFDDRSTRNQRKTLDRLAPIREVFDKFIINCQNSYYPAENVTIDEMLPGFRGRCSFRQYIPSKPNKYGIKIFALVDAKMFYTFNMEIYAGTQPEGPFRVSNKPVDVVKRLAAPLFGSGRNITADNWFTDFNLIHELKTQRLSYVGTVRKNKRHLPYSFIDLKERTQYSSLFGFNNGTTLVSYIPRKGKNVILASSLHIDDNIDPSSGNMKKPEMITFYNSTKCGVDTLDQMCANYNVHRNIKRWPMEIFFAMLNVGGINSQVIHLCNQLEPLRRRRFLKQLSHELVIEHMRRRSQMTSGLHTSIQVRLKRFFPRDDREKSPEVPKNRKKRSTCSLEGSKRRLSSYACRKCNNHICLTHANMVCNACFPEYQLVPPKREWKRP
ncbi:piggyBac transposable element-derived protein 4-like [Harmonia axyridis]|uniref:piggyBac transposable element-derived protein 4-like n=1 Tax=Harmonia axyridis TaxID=115357 RepID=UPI001E2780AE|nr:piggyBac transposable element-derived protein 4-like [Harmonia axyridis]